MPEPSAGALQVRKGWRLRIAVRSRLPRTGGRDASHVGSGLPSHACRTRRGRPDPGSFVWSAV